MDRKQIVYVLFAGFLLFLAAPSTEAAGQEAPDFNLTDTQGNSVSLSALKGKIVVLEWNNYDCPFVKAHYNDKTYTMRKLAAKYAGKNVVWLTINSTHYATTEALKQWTDQHKLEQTVLLDKDGKVGRLYKAQKTPHLFIVDTNGMIAYRGAIDNAPFGKKPADGEYVNYVDQALAELTAGKSVTVKQTKPYGCSVKYANKGNSK